MKTLSELQTEQTAAQEIVNALDAKFNKAYDAGKMSEAKAQAPKLAAARKELVDIKNAIDKHPDTKLERRNYFAGLINQAKVLESEQTMSERLVKRRKDLY